MARALMSAGSRAVVLKLGNRCFYSDGVNGSAGSRFRGKRCGYDGRGGHLQRRAGGCSGRGCADKQALRFANAAGAISVTRAGAQPSLQPAVK